MRKLDNVSDLVNWTLKNSRKCTIVPPKKDENKDDLIVDGLKLFICSLWRSLGSSVSAVLKYRAASKSPTFEFAAFFRRPTFRTQCLRVQAFVQENYLTSINGNGKTYMMLYDMKCTH